MSCLSARHSLRTTYFLCWCIAAKSQEQEPADELGQEESQSQPDTDMPEQNGEAPEVASEPAEDEAEEAV